MGINWDEMFIGIGLILSGKLLFRLVMLVNNLQDYKK